MTERTFIVLTLRLLIGLAAILVSRASMAAYQRVSVSFDVPLGEQPDRVCFISKTSSTGFLLGDLTKYVKVSGSNGEYTFTKPNAAPSETSSAQGGADQASADKLHSVAEDYAGLIAQPKGAGEAPGSCSTSACAATLSVSEKDWGGLRAVCWENRQPRHPKNPQVVFVRLEFQQPKDLHLSPAVDEPDFSGTVASVAVADDKLTRDVVMTARVIGGHYLPSSDVVVSADYHGQYIATLPLVPRCRYHDVHLPFAPQSDRTVRAEVKVFVAKTQSGSEETGSPKDGAGKGEGPQDPLICESAEVDGQQLSTRLPYGHEHELKTVVVRIGEPGDHTFAQFAASWVGERPPPALQLQATSISFGWQRQPLYRDTDACPVVELMNVGGGTCQDKGEPLARPACWYTCGALEPLPSQKAINLPGPVRFTSRASTKETWTDVLPGPSLILDSFVRTDLRTLYLDFSSWDPSVKHHDVDSVSITIPGRSSFPQQEVLQHVALSVPGYMRGDALVIEPHGDRPMGTIEERIDGTSMRVPAPTLRSPLATSVLLGGGVGVPFAHSGLPEAPPAWPFGQLDLALSFRPLGWILSIDVHGSLMATEQAYYPVSNSSANALPTSVASYRAGGLIGTSFRLVPRIVVGPAVGIMWSSPFSGNDSQVVDSGARTWVTAILARFQASATWGVELQGGLDIGEQYKWFQGGIPGDALVQTGVATAFYVSLGLRDELTFLPW